MATIMAGILGLVAVIIRPAIDGLGKCIGEPIKRKFNYLCCFNNNVKDLESEAKKLGDARYDVQSRVTIAQNNAQIVTPQVLSWLGEVNEIQSKKPVIDNEITTTKNGGCSTAGCGYSLSKKVKEMAEAMKELRESGSFTTIAHPPPPAAMVSINIRSTMEFDSRKCVEEEIMASLRDEETNMVGICGMGGVGKTTMAKNIMHRAREELGFEETVMTVVSQDVDMVKIQDDVAKSLGLSLGEGSLSSKAHELHTRLSADTRRSLIVIDDVWGKLELEGLGIPCNSRCKVLITSRNSHILKTMDVEKLHAVQALPETEAWELFKSKAGSCIEQEHVVDVACKVVEECKGLPIALVTVGLALKDMANISTWNTTLCQLKSSNPSRIPEVLKFVYQPLKLSYDLLDTKEEKSLFLLCCLFPEDGYIPLETLSIYCMGLQIFEDIPSLERARETTGFLIDRLKNRFLVLECWNEYHVKMHDVVRDVGIFIAAEEKRIKCNECTWISPHIGERIWAYGGSSLFPNIHLLWIDCESRDKELEIHSDFFDGMRELKVLMFKCRSLQQLPETIGLLENLRTLVLEGCGSLENMCVVGHLVNLEILICPFCRKIESLPVEIGRLRCLRLLEISDCWKLKTIPPGIISKLIKLEELTVRHFDRWEARIVEGERRNAPLCELEHLTCLTRLKIQIRDFRLAAEQFHLSSTMLKFNIAIGHVLYSFLESTIYLVLPSNISLGNWIRECARNAEYIYLKGDGSSSLDLQVAQKLRKLTIHRCSTVKKLMTTPFPLLEHLELKEVKELEEICDIQHNLASIFNNLSSIIIVGCGRLRCLFSLSLMETPCFLQLKRLEIRRCEIMEQVLFCNEEEEEVEEKMNICIFSKLEFIVLDSLPKLTSFIRGVKGIEFHQLSEMEIIDCPLLKGFVGIEFRDGHHYRTRDDSIHFFCQPHEVIKLDYLSKLEIHGELRGNWDPQISIDSFARLRELRVSKYKGMKSLFSISMMTRGSHRLHLEMLEIKSCEMMEQVFLWNEEQNQASIRIPLLFPKLKVLRLDDLSRLTSFIKGIQGIELPRLDQMAIVNCPLLKSFVCSEFSDDQHYHTHDDSINFFCQPHEVFKFNYLSKLEIRGELRGNWSTPQISNDSFARLRELKVSNFKGMKSLFSISMMTRGSHRLRLEMLEIKSCEMMEQVFLWNLEQNQASIRIPLLFPKLKVLRLDDLSRLTSFIKGIQSIEFPQLDQMAIVNCPLMKSFVCSESPDDHHDCDNDSIYFSCKSHVVKFGKLRKLEVDMERNLCFKTPVDSFTGLVKLYVFGLIGFKSLFSFSRSGNGCLDQLEKLEIRHCDMIEQVISWNEEENLTDIYTTPIFPKLNYLILDSLPRLTSLGKGIQFSVPTVVRILNCPLIMESCVSTTSMCDDTIHLFCKSLKVESDCRLGQLKIHGCDEKMRKWCPQIPIIGLFVGLWMLDVSELKGMKSLFPCSIARMMPNIKYLDISRCEEMVTVIKADDACGAQTQAEAETDTPPILLFPKLTSLRLINLPKLRSFCECGLHELSHSSSLCITNCGMMDTHSIQREGRELDLNRGGGGD